MQLRACPTKLKANAQRYLQMHSGVEIVGSRINIGLRQILALARDVKLMRDTGEVVPTLTNAALVLIPTRAFRAISLKGLCLLAARGAQVLFNRK